MIDLSTLQEKVNDLKAQILQNSITPVYLGTLLDEFIARMHDLDMTDRDEDIQQAVEDAADAVAAALEALAASGTASANSAQALAEASEALDKANTAIAAAQAAQAAAESAANSAGVAQSFADHIPTIRNGSSARFSAFVTGPVVTVPQDSGSSLEVGGGITGDIQPSPGGPAGGVSSIGTVVYLKEKKAFALKSGSHFYLPWTSILPPMSMFNDSSNKALKNKVFICGDKAYVWSPDAADLVETAADKAPLSMFVVLSEDDFEDIASPDPDTFYYTYED